MVVLKTKKTVFLNTESIESTSVKLEFYLQQIEHCLKTYPEKHMNLHKFPRKTIVKVTNMFFIEFLIK